MKKLFNLALLGAIALTGAVGFSSCSSSNDEVINNPDYNPEQNSVKTQFSISLPWDKNNSKTRQGGDVVQAAQNVTSFRGMQDIVLIPFFNATDRTARFGTNIALAANSLLKPNINNTANSIPAGNLLADVNGAVLYNDVTIPVYTKAFIFYGKASGEDGYANGFLTPAGLTGETSGISFTPTQIKATPVTTKGEAIATYVSSIAAAADATDASITWAGCANTANATQTWYSAALRELYTNFTKMKAGASSYVQAAVQDLYAAVRNSTDKVSKAIKTSILNATYASDASDSGTLTFTAAISGYPGGDNNDMPDGAAALTWNDATPKVATAATSSSFGSGTMGAIAMSSIVYPASLYYFVDSPILTSNASRATDYNTTDSWATITGKYTNGGEVSTSTRSVAISNPVQYAVGRLDVTVNKLNATTYYDRRGDVVTLPTTGFLLTGVLIGGQKAVDYKFQPTGTTDYTIYDKTINTTSVSAYVTTTANAGPNYTLALETAKDQTVYVALEFLNNSGKDFLGVDGVVKNRCKFYMIAELDPKNTAAGAPTPSNYDNTGGKVFKQDFNTIATFTIGAGSADGDHDGVSDTPGGFANAYTTIPDMRTPQLELGFSVDLQWRTGMTFEYTF